jgi:L-serine dehydratase
VREKHGYSHEKVIEALIVAAGLGALAFTHTHVNGNAGCVAESGICCAMAAGALVWLAGGDGYQVENAASMALQSSIGIPCDPIPGGLEFPCLTRTFRAAVTAPLYADLALSGIDPLIPYHEMLQEIERNFQQTDPQHLCSSQAGCCRTPSAQKLLGTLDLGAGQTLSFSPGDKEASATHAT